jgi:hypothetical protein
VGVEKPWRRNGFLVECLLLSISCLGSFRQ